MSGAFREGKMEKNNLGLNYFDPNFLKLNDKIKNYVWVNRKKNRNDQYFR